MVLLRLCWLLVSLGGLLALSSARSGLMLLIGCWVLWLCFWRRLIRAACTRHPRMVCEVVAGREFCEDCWGYWR